MLSFPEAPNLIKDLVGPSGATYWIDLKAEEAKGSLAVGASTNIAACWYVYAPYAHVVLEWYVVVVEAQGPRLKFVLAPIEPEHYAGEVFDPTNPSKYGYSDVEISLDLPNSHTQAIRLSKELIRGLVNGKLDPSRYEINDWQTALDFLRKGSQLDD